MTRAQRKSLVRWIHRWLGTTTAVLVGLVSVTGILLQHPEWLGQERARVHCVAADPVDPLRLLRGTQWGVEESVDGALNWHEVPMLAPPTDVRRLVFAAGVGGEHRVYALGARTGVVSSDGGRVWRSMSLPPAAVQDGAVFLDLAIALNGEQTLLTSHGTYRRSGAGDWTAVGPRLANSRDWRQSVHDLHTGQFAGAAGRRMMEIGAWGLVVLTLTGILLAVRNRRRHSP